MTEMTKLIRVQDETYKSLQKLAGRIQAKSGKKCSLDKAIQNLLAEKGQKQGARTPKTAKAGEAEEFADSMKWFSLHHKSFQAEKTGK
ncbi:hypothetical protein HY572_00405 [Candidatus Micrarchaeota archaeon]|nr:hypothetical protein [Candidatus Micrarchaeota archaeon]